MRWPCSDANWKDVEGRPLVIDGSGAPSTTTVTADEFIASLEVTLPPLETFTELGDLTALRRDGRGVYYRSNYLRGQLLYALVLARRPQTILEFGTGRGYASLCMARALHDLGLPGQILTIDLVPPERPIEWDYREAGGARTRYVSRRAFWRQRFPAAWLERIVELCGHSDEIVSTWAERGLPAIDLAFVDGGHDLRTARHDLLAAFLLSGPKLGLLADDVADQPGYGVRQALMETAASLLPIALIPTSWRPPSADWDGRGAMAWVNTDGYAQALRMLRSLSRSQRPHISWERQGIRRGIKILRRALGLVSDHSAPTR